MIEINLSEKRKSKEKTYVFGTDISKINVKVIIGSLVLLYLPDYTIFPYWEEERAKLEATIKDLTKTLEQETKETTGQDEVQKELVAYNEQVEKLKKRSEQIDEILKVRTNPKKLLERIARVIPTDLWFDEMTLNSNKELMIKGASISYKSIGSFIVAANESPFFGKSITLKESKTREQLNNGINERVEEFIIEGRVDSFDPFEK